ncbi:MAG: ATP-dependent DNA helicase PcrA [Thermoleophilia bacterium]|nr:ATP-dependent DNA helicase PcrA [Thermoleophilia bacterium]
MSTNALTGLNPAQLEAVVAEPGPILVVAGAGSGKTRVLTHRIAHLVDEHGAAPASILAITFTNKAAGEMAERVNRALGRSATGMWVMTFHAACARILRAEATRIGFRQSFSIYDASDQVRLVRSIIEDDLGKDSKRYPARGVHARISDAKNRLISAEQFADDSDGYFDTTVGEVYLRYQSRLLEAGAMDFDDLLVHTAHLLEQIPAAREKWQTAFKHVLVDEYQDTNHAQYRLIRSLAEGHRSIFVVGDSDQSIYSWRGADIRNILDFEKDFPNARTIRLEQNYRSTQHILDAANAVIEHNQGRQAKRLWSELGQGEPVRVVECQDERSEARFVVGQIARVIGEGGSLRDVAIFYRTNAQSRALEEALRQADVPYRIIGGTGFYDRQEIKDALAYLRAIANPSDDVSLRRIINVPRRAIGDTTVSRLTEHAAMMGVSLRLALLDADSILPGSAARKAVTGFAALMDRLAAAAVSMEPAELLERIYDETAMIESLRAERTLEANGRIENLDELLGVARSATLTGQPEADLAMFLQELSLVSDADQLPDTDDDSAVTMMTLHTAKGLEFPRVYMVGMEDNIFPHARALEEANLEEERRLCYVGMTRAREQLTMTYARTRSLYGRQDYNPPSTFLREIPAEYVDHERVSSRGGTSLPSSPGALVGSPGTDYSVAGDCSGAYRGSPVDLDGRHGSSPPLGRGHCDRSALSRGDPRPLP